MEGSKEARYEQPTTSIKIRHAGIVWTEASAHGKSHLSGRLLTFTMDSPPCRDLRHVALLDIADELLSDILWMMSVSRYERHYPLCTPRTNNRGQSTAAIVATLVHMVWCCLMFSRKAHPSPTSFFPLSTWSSFTPVHRAPAVYFTCSEFIAGKVI